MAMEAWDMKYKPNSDWNHAWGAVPANIIPGYMWGIVPAEPGFAAVTIRPQFSGLTYSKIEVPTIRGKIVAEFRTKGKSSEYTVNIPANMKGKLILPGMETFELSPGINSLKQVHTVKTQ